MNSKYRLTFVFSCVYIIFISFNLLAQRAAGTENLSRQLTLISSRSSWQLTDSVKLKFNAFHTQGMVKVGDYFYISSVEINQPTKRFSIPQNGYDRDVGKGVGHLFKIDKNGQLIKDIIVGEGDMYHPGGIDFDGKYIWLPVAEYRPNSRSVICRYNIETEELENLFYFADHIGTVVRNKRTNQLIMASWGAENLYTLKLRKQKTPEISRSKVISNRFRFIDYQDSQYVGDGLMFGTGIGQYMHPDGSKFVLGGWQLTDLKTGHSVWQLPINKFLPGTGNSLVRNPCFIEQHQEGIKAWFAPDDDHETVIYGFVIHNKQ